MVTPTSNYDELQDLANRFGTPFYLLHADVFLNNYTEIESAFRSRYNNFLIGYSYKTNYIPYLCNLIREAGGYAEVVSRLEYDLALKIKQDPAKIIFNGPVKRAEDIALALHNKSLVNLDCWYEIDHVSDFSETNPDENIEVGLRVNIDLTDEDGKSAVQDGLDSGRFGFDVSRDGIYKAIQLLTDLPNVSVTCLHGHCSSSTRSLWVYDRITRTLCDIAAETGLESIRYIDVGGGIFGKIPETMRLGNTPSFNDYAETICSALLSYQWVQDRMPTLILEPGVAMTADCMSFVAEVLDLKRVSNNNYVLVDGSIFNIKPSMHKHNQPYTFLSPQPRCGENTYKVCGYTCMEKDILLDNIVYKNVQRGDYLIIDNVGAYTVVMCPPFITNAPPILAKIDGDFKVIRRRQDIASFFGDYNFL